MSEENSSVSFTHLYKHTFAFEHTDTGSKNVCVCASVLATKTERARDGQRKIDRKRETIKNTQKFLGKRIE